MFCFLSPFSSLSPLFPSFTFQALIQHSYTKHTILNIPFGNHHSPSFSHNYSSNRALLNQSHSLSTIKLKCTPPKSISQLYVYWSEEKRPHDKKYRNLDSKQKVWFQKERSPVFVDIRRQADIKQNQIKNKKFQRQNIQHSQTFTCLSIYNTQYPRKKKGCLHHSIRPTQQTITPAHSQVPIQTEKNVIDQQKARKKGAGENWL